MSSLSTLYRSRSPLVRRTLTILWVCEWVNAEPKSTTSFHFMEQSQMRHIPWNELFVHFKLNCCFRTNKQQMPSAARARATERRAYRKSASARTSQWTESTVIQIDTRTNKIYYLKLFQSSRHPHIIILHTHYTFTPSELCGTQKITKIVNKF